MEYQREFEGLRKRLGIERSRASGSEAVLARAFWSGLVEAARAKDPEGWQWIAHLVEEALVWRMVSFRLVNVVGEGPLLVSKKASTEAGVDSVHPAVDALAKAQERLNKVMKELTERLDAAGGGQPVNLPDMMKPILEQAEGVLEYALEPKPRKKRTKKKTVKSRMRKNMA